MLKKEVKTSTGLIIIFAAAVIIFGGCYTWAAYKDPGNYSSPAVVTSSVKKAATSTTATPAATDETKDWQTYENKTYAYSIKYPKDWYIETDNSEKAFSKRGTEGTLIGGDTAWSNYQNFDFTLDTLPADRQLVSLMIYSDRSDLDTFIANDNRRKYALTEKKNLKIDGKDAVQYLVTFIDVPTGVQERVTLIKNNDQIFRLSYGVIKNKDQTITYSDMVGSIKFADTTADWQTYSNPDLKFSIKYPSDWLSNIQSITENNILYLLTKERKQDLDAKKIVRVFDVSVKVYKADSELPNNQTDKLIFEDWIKQKADGYGFIKRKSIVIDGANGYQGVGEESYLIFVQKGNNIYEIGTGDTSTPTEIEQKIINSFKFTK